MLTRTTFRKRCTAMLSASSVVLVSAVFGLGAAPIAHADPVKVSREVGVPLKEATELAQAKDYRTALTKLDAAEAAAKTANERYQISSVRRYVYVQTKAYPQLASVLESQMASGQMSASEVKTAKRELIQIYDKAGNKQKSVKAAKDFVTEYGHDSNLTIFVAADALDAKDYNTAADWASKAIDGEIKASRVPPETWYRALMKARFEKGDTAGYYKAMEDAVVRYPSDTYWRALVGRAATQSNYSSDRLGLDEYRALAAAGVKLTAEEKLTMAETAFERELSAEAFSVLEPMKQSGELEADASKAARNVRLLNKAKSEADADRTALASIVAEAKKKGDGVALANVAELTMTFGDPKGAVTLYQAALAAPGLDAIAANTAKLRMGIAQHRAGDTAAAKKTWNEIQGKDGAAELAKVWLLATSRT